MPKPVEECLHISENALQDLINQFADPYAFLRELVQNAIDARASRVNVTYDGVDGPPGAVGIAILRVDDNGLGMSREIIDTRLTRLFSSGKEDDLSMIGQFGIGFVSVFALNPAAVVVDTGREGEAWRVFFKEDRTFDRIVLDRPVDGTSIQLVHQFTDTQAEAYRERCQRSLSDWCRFCSVEVLFDGRTVNQPFGLEEPYAIVDEQPGLRCVVAPTLDPSPIADYYTHGLTLCEGKRSPIPGVRFRLDCDTLSYTLTRDNVLQTEQLDKALARLRTVVATRLRPHLFGVAADCQDRAELDRIFGFLSFHVEGLTPDLASQPLLPTISGAGISLRQLRLNHLRWGQTYASTEPSADGRCDVLLWRGPEEEPGLGRLVRAVTGTAPCDGEPSAVLRLSRWMLASAAAAAGLAWMFLHSAAGRR